MFADLAEKLGVPVETLNKDFELFKTKVSSKFDGLQGEELENRAASLFRQKYRAQKNSAMASPAIPIKIFVAGVSKITDKMKWKVDPIVAAYKKNPAKAFFDGKVNEYRTDENGFMKSSQVTTRVKGKVERNKVDEVVTELPDGAIAVDDLWIVPRDFEAVKWGKVNPYFGFELAPHDYNRDVFGVAESLDNSDEDIRFIHLLLRGNKADTEDLPIPGKAYIVKALDIGKSEATYSFKDSPSQTKWDNEIEWNPYNKGSFFEQVLEESFMGDFVEELGNLRDIAETEALIKAQNKERKEMGEAADWKGVRFNSCYFVAADIIRLSLEPEDSKKSSRIVIDDDSCKWEFNGAEMPSITGWLSDQATKGVNFGEWARVILCCNPRFGKGQNGELPPLNVDVYGALAYEIYVTKPAEEIDDLSDE